MIYLFFTIILAAVLLIIFAGPEVPIERSEKMAEEYMKYFPEVPEDQK